MSSAAQQLRSNPTFVQFQNKGNQYLAQLDKELSRYPVLNQFEARTQVPKSYGVIGSVFLLILLMLVNALASPVSNLIGWGLPAYLSFQAIESPGHEDDIQWLTYWVTFGFFNFLESFAISIVLYYVPFYYAFKTIFILWLQLPATRGARTLYVSVFRPVLANANAMPGRRTDTAHSDDLRSKVQTATHE
jgi:receptor expression-enhancing protein 5/6